MYPVLFKFQLSGREIVIGSYGVLIILGLVTGIFLSIRIGRYFSYNRNDIINCSLLIIAGSMIGTFLAGFFLFLPERINSGFFKYPPVFISWGGISGGLVVLLIIKKAWSLNLLDFADILTPGYLTGLGIGRIGCFLGGCCFGLPTDLPFGIQFTHKIAPASSMNLPLIPVQLISALFLVIPGILFIIFVFKRKIPGKIFFCSTIVYSVFRFTIEFFRADPRKFIFGLSDGQVFSTVFLLVGISGLIYIHRKIKNKDMLINN